MTGMRPGARAAPRRAAAAGGLSGCRGADHQRARARTGRGRVRAGDRRRAAAAPRADPRRPGSPGRAGRVRRAAARSGGTGLRRPARPAGLPGGGVPLRPGVRRRLQQPGAGTGAGPGPGRRPGCTSAAPAGRPAASRSGSRCGTGCSACTPTSPVFAGDGGPPVQRARGDDLGRQHLPPARAAVDLRSLPGRVRRAGGAEPGRIRAAYGQADGSPARRRRRRAAPGCRWTAPASPGGSGSAPSARTPATRCGRSMPWPTPSPRRRSRWRASAQLAGDLEIFASPAFGYLTLDASLCRASVLMPQKRNPYALAVLRGGAGTLIGRLTGLLATGLTPSARTDNWLYAYGEVAGAVDLAGRLVRLGPRCWPASARTRACWASRRPGTSPAPPTWPRSCRCASGSTTARPTASSAGPSPPRKAAAKPS